MRKTNIFAMLTVGFVAGVVWVAACGGGSSGGSAIGNAIADTVTALSVTYDNTTSGMTAATVQAALDELKSGAFTAANAVTAVKEADGSGSGVDADTTDGYHASSFVLKAGDTMTGGLTVGGAVTATTLALSSEKTGYLSVPGSAFLPKSNTAYDTTANHLDRLAGAAAQMFVAPVNLPNGAIVTTVTTYAYNNDDPGDTLTIYFDKYTLNETAAASNISTINAVTTQSANIQTASHSPNETINNSTIAYALRAVFSTNNANLRLRGVLITYTYDTF